MLAMTTPDRIDTGSERRRGRGRGRGVSRMMSARGTRGRAPRQRSEEPRVEKIQPELEDDSLTKS